MTGSRIKSPESLRLIMSHAQSRHLCVLRADAAKEVID